MCFDRRFFFFVFQSLVVHGSITILIQTLPFLNFYCFDGFVRIKECEKRTAFVAPFFLFELNWNFFLRIRLQKLYFVF